MSLPGSPSAVLSGALLILASHAHGANQWNGVNSQFWDDALNWTQGVPATGQEVAIDDSLAPPNTLVSYQSPIDLMLASLVIDGDPGSAMTLDLATK